MPYVATNVLRTAIEQADRPPANKWGDQTMGKSTYKWLAIVIAVALSLGVAACAGAPTEDVEGAADSGSMHAEAGEESGEHGEGGEGRGEERGEHGEGGEGRGEERGEHGEGGEGEHGEEGGHGEGEEGEESGIYIARSETWDRTLRGARLVLKFDAERNAFVGTVENTTEQTLCAVRVEVHLDTPKELGPTPRTDVPAGGKIDVELSTEGNTFQTWTAHPEVSSCGGL